MANDSSFLLDSAQFAAPENIDSFEASMEPPAAVEASMCSIVVESWTAPPAVAALEASLEVA